MADRIRYLAYSVLERQAAQGSYSNLALDHVIRREGLSGVDRGFLTALVYGTIEKQHTIDYYLTQLSERPFAGLYGSVKTILRMGAYQVLFLDRVPDHAACDESVELTKRVARHAAPFVNGVLRSLVRQKQALPMPDPADRDLYLSVKYSAPTWLCGMWRTQYGDAEAEQILAAMSEPSAITLRTNTLRITREELLAELGAAGIEAVPAPNAWGILLPAKCPVSELSALTEGKAYVMDLASQMVTDALDARPGELVADVCACPGGKSFSMAMCMENKGTIESFDLHRSKLSLIESGAERLGITCITVAERDGSKPDPARKERYDRVLCDVPCSGLGVLAKKPDLRHKGETEIVRLPQVQGRILAESAALVKKGGVLVYSTCTLHKLENEEAVRAFLATHTDYALVEERTFFPHTDGTDGFYFAKMIRQGERE